MSYKLTDDQVAKVQLINAKIVSTKGLIKEVSTENNTALLNTLLERLAQYQIDYEEWFENMKSEYSITTNSSQSWTVDFKGKTLQILG